MKGTGTFIENITAEMVEQLKKDNALWTKNWSSQKMQNNRPFNPVTNKLFNGINFLNLFNKSLTFNDPRWLTKIQAEKIGATIKSSEKGTMVQYWEMSKDNIPLQFPKRHTTLVYNATQIDNMPKLEESMEKIKKAYPFIEASKIINNSFAKIQHKPNCRAFYAHQSDTITLSNIEEFNSKESYYSTVLHELGHWTSHASRLNRKIVYDFSAIDQDKEELRVAIATFLTSAKLGISFNPAGHDIYHKNWISLLEESPYELMQAISDANNISNFVLNFKEQKQTENETQEKTDDKIIEYLISKLQKNKSSSVLISQKNANLLIEQYGTVQKQSNTNVITGLNLGKNGKFILSQKNSKGATYSSLSHRKEWRKDLFIVAKNQEKITKDKSQFQVLTQNSLLLEIREALNIGIREEDLISIAEAKIYLDKSNSYDIRESVEWINKTLKERENINENTHKSLIYLSKLLSNRYLSKKDNTFFKDKTYLSVPYEDNKDQINRAKNAGAKWDADFKCWYAPKGSNKIALSEWLIENKEITTLSKQSHGEGDSTLAFQEALTKAGLERVDEPIFDGRWHRVKTMDDQKGKKSGSYIGTQDAFLNGAVKNFKLGEVVPFKSNAYKNINKAHYAELKALSIAKNLHRETEELKTHEQVSKQVGIKFKYLEDAKNENPYLSKKGVISFGLKEDKRNNLIMPLVDVSGKMWSWQSINTFGKMLAKNGKKEGCFHLLGKNKINDIEEAIIVEGYATGATIHMVTGKTVVVAVDSGNLKEVAKNIREIHNNIPILIAGDNDILNERHAKNESLKKKANVGKIKAEAAAEEVGGFALITPLTENEIKKGLSDFNDIVKTQGADFVKELIQQGLLSAKERINQYQKSILVKKKYPSLDINTKDYEEIEDFIASSIQSELEMDNTVSDVTKERIIAYGSLMDDKALIEAVESEDKEDLAALGDYFQELSQNEYLSYDGFKEHISSQTVA